jgi:hypothetical protein
LRPLQAIRHLLARERRGGYGGFQACGIRLKPAATEPWTCLGSFYWE